MRLLLPNFIFEDQLTGRPSRQTAETQRAADELAPLLALLAEPGDTVIVRDGADPGDLPECLDHVAFAPFGGDLADGELIPWGWSPQSAAVAATLGMDEARRPTVEAVRQINSRTFSARFDDVTGANSPIRHFAESRFGRLCHDVDEWRSAVSDLSLAGYDRWVAKPQISHAGRNRLIANGQQLNNQQRGWLEKHLWLGGSVYVEPWVHISAECGLQFDIEADGPVRFLGAAELLNDPVGRYRGSLIRADADVATGWLPAVEHGTRLCRFARETGYFGPLGVDCMMFRDSDGNEQLRLVNDINGRFTMGRLALQLQSLLQPGEWGVWWHTVARASAQPTGLPEFSLSPSMTEHVRTVRTNPKSIGHRPVRAASALYVGGRPKELATLLELLRRKPTN